jgi:hypothetical protein
MLDDRGLDDVEEVSDALVYCVFRLDDVCPYGVDNEVLDYAYHDAFASGIKVGHVCREARHLSTFNHLVLTNSGEKSCLVEAINIGTPNE